MWDDGESIRDLQEMEWMNGMRSLCRQEKKELNVLADGFSSIV